MAMTQRGGGRGRGVFAFIPPAAVTVTPNETETATKDNDNGSCIPGETQPASTVPAAHGPGRGFGQGVPGAGRGFGQGVPGVGRGMVQGIVPGAGHGLSQGIRAPSATGRGTQIPINLAAGRGRGGIRPVQPSTTAVSGTSATVFADTSKVPTDTANGGPVLQITYGPRVVVGEPQPETLPEKAVEKVDAAISAAKTADKVSEVPPVTGIVPEVSHQAPTPVVARKAPPRPGNVDAAPAVEVARPIDPPASVALATAAPEVAVATEIRGLNPFRAPQGFQPLSAPPTRPGTVLQQLRKLFIQPKVEAKDHRVEPPNAGNLDEIGTPLPVPGMGDDFQHPGSNPVRETKISSLVMDVIVVHVSGLHDFYITPKATRFAKLGLLEKRMDKWYKDYSATFPAPKKEELVVNGQYAGFISAVNAWRRIVFRGWTSDSLLLVQLLDDGGSHAIRIEDIRLLREVFCTLPIQAYHAKIQMVEGETWTAEETEIFKQETNNKPFMAVLLADEKDPEFAPFHTVGVALLETGVATKIYNFGGRLRFGYAFEDETKCTVPVYADTD